jgi:C1A family cysteine protease
VDWREWGIVNSVRNQGTCGSCYAFATCGAAEISYAIKTGIRYNLSEQYLVDCGNGFGCDGGSRKEANYLMAT